MISSIPYRGIRRGALALASATLFAMPLAAQDVRLPVGTMAPAVALSKLDGTMMDLSKYVGKGPVVLEFWATWCPLCKQLEPAMHAAQEKYKGKVTFIGVGVKDNQTVEKQAKYVADKTLGGEFVFDGEGKAVAAFKAPHTSYLVVLDAKGMVVYTGVGGDQNVDAAVAKALKM